MARMRKINTLTFLILLSVVLLSCSGRDKLRSVGGAGFESASPENEVPAPTQKIETDGDGHGISGNKPMIQNLRAFSSGLLSGTQVALVGSGFVTGIKIFFDAVECNRLLVSSATELTCYLGADTSSTALIQMVLPNGESAEIPLSSVAVTLSNWDATSSISAPRGRFSHSQIWTGSKMIVWGGTVHNTAQDYTADGASYDPVADSWSVISSLNAPLARASHSTVWTGTNILVFGGVSKNGGSTAMFVNSGGIYNVATDSWIATPTTNAPSPRANSVSHYAGGSSIVFFGGNTVGSIHNDLYIFNTNTLSWSSVNAVGAPSPRSECVSIWTGTKMINWAGSSGSTYYRDGAAFDFGSLTWSAISDASLAPRTQSIGFWTGTKMIVWGGAGASNAKYNDGALYNLATDTWSNIANENAPSPRHTPAGVWTGSKMLVFGGSNGSPLTDGGEYDLATNAWKSISSVGGPSARSLSKAIWTGQEMIVWGGSKSVNPGEEYDSVGGRYSP